VEITKLKSGGVYEERESYSRLVQVGDWVFMANTAGRDMTTRVMSEDPIEQLHQCISNIKNSLAQVECELGDVVRSRVFIQYREDAADVMAVYGEYFRGIDPTATVICSPLGSPDYKVEIEVTAYKGAGKMEQSRRSFKL
jgi:enamine deaminase RidA (YjgF/YER057c/UK114 family)